MRTPMLIGPSAHHWRSDWCLGRLNKLLLLSVVLAFILIKIYKAVWTWIYKCRRLSEWIHVRMLVGNVKICGRTEVSRWCDAVMGLTHHHRNLARTLGWLFEVSWTWDARLLVRKDIRRLGSCRFRWTTKTFQAQQGWISPSCYRSSYSAISQSDRLCTTCN